VDSRSNVNTSPAERDRGRSSPRKGIKPVEGLNQHRARVEQCPKNGEEGVNTIFLRLANIDNKPNRAHFRLTNTFNVFV
jgi:hypothetical protein